MARRATPSSKKATTVGDAPPAKTSRRGKQAKSPDMPASEMPVADAFFPGGEEVPSEPAPARRRRTPKAPPVAAPLATDEGPAHEADQAPETPPAPQSSAARWNAATGTATFDWPSIEQVAAAEGPNQAMAKLLLAARAEGANSRWPF